MYMLSLILISMLEVGCHCDAGLTWTIFEKRVCSREPLRGSRVHMAAPALRANAPGLTLRAAFTLSLVLISAASQTCADVDGGDADDAFSSCSLYADPPSDCGKFDDETFENPLQLFLDIVTEAAMEAIQLDEGNHADLMNASLRKLEFLEVAIF